MAVVENLCILESTVMDNDYLTSLLVILLTNLLNNHCTWLYVVKARMFLKTSFIDKLSKNSCKM